MVEALFLVERTVQPDNDIRDGIRNVIINNDDGDADAVIIANAVTAVNALFPSPDAENKLPTGYFDLVSQIDVLSAGPLATDQDVLVYTREVGSVRT